MDKTVTQHNPETSFSIVDFSSVEDAPKVWQEIVDASLDGWIWHTYTALSFNLCAGEEHNAENHSFFVYKNNKPVGVVPLTIQEKDIGGSTGREAKYYSGFLPWPCFRAEENSFLTALEDFAFEELERRAKVAKVGHICMQLTPPVNQGDEHKRIERIVQKYTYVHSRVDSHIVVINPETLSLVRKRYKRYYKKFSPLFALSIKKGKDVTKELEELYFNLHVRDAGGQFRSRKSYEKQADIARTGEGFYVVATDKVSNAIVGMLLISVYKKSAFDNSVAIDPDFADKYVGHLLKWRAIEELLDQKISTYELPVKPSASTFWEPSTPKKRNISHFKEGWARGNMRTVFQIDKFLNKSSLHDFILHQENLLINYFNL